MPAILKNLPVLKPSSPWAFIVTLVVLVASIKPGRSQSSSPPFSNESDLVVDLPDQPSVNFRHYAGYVRVNDDKSLFYWFYEAMESPMNKPLVLWLNGGPGCSSVSIGALREIGPFRVLYDSLGMRLGLNPFAWNKDSNLLFLDSPVGVGFSYSNKTSDLEALNDMKTAEDSYTFLINWFVKYPMLKPHEFYITGESYAGRYAPQLAELIHERNKNATKDAYINLKGLMIGNPVLGSWSQTATGAISTKFAWSRGIIPYNLYQTITNECKASPEDHSVENINKNCEEGITATGEIFNQIDEYNILQPTCSLSKLYSKIQNGLKTDATTYEPCSALFPELYLSQPSVQKALHANVTGLPYPYSTCSNNILDAYKSEVTTVLTALRNLMDGGYRVWIYSGDADGSIPMASTRESIRSMNLTEKMCDRWGGWRKWYYEGQIAGWMVEYAEGLTFITVRGSGHMVPIFSPNRALLLFSRFLEGKPLPFSATRP